jgi:ATP-dependent RNA helicase DeaD
MKFEELNIKPELVKALHELGYKQPTEIQEASIPLIKANRDIIGISKTGSGKTAAFGVPMLEKIMLGHGIQALIMAPTRELAVQISQELGKFGKYVRCNIATVYGGISLLPQIERMAHAEIIVGTPGRILDHIERGNLRMPHVKMVVLDEADKMVDMGFIDDVRQIINNTPKHKQMLLFGATISDEINQLKERYMHEPATVKTQMHVQEEFLQQYYYNIEPHEKFSLLMHILRKEESKRVIIFCSTRTTVMLVAKNLRKQGVNSESIHGNLNQNQRLRVMNNFKHGELQVLVASAVAARGIDVKDVTHIINYDLSKDPQEYIHRVGRTARAGESGKAITLLSPRDHDAFTSILKKYDVKVKLLPKEHFEKVFFDARISEFHRGGFQRDGMRRPFHQSFHRQERHISSNDNGWNSFD